MVGDDVGIVGGEIGAGGENGIAGGDVEMVEGFIKFRHVGVNEGSGLWR